jgi:thioredoxin reductase (NADPH)
VQPILRAENVDVRLATEVVQARGDHQLEALTVLHRASGAREDLPVSLLLVLIGAMPQSGWLASAVACDPQGFVLTGAAAPAADGRTRLRLETSMPGVFAAGDVRHGSVKRVASAVGEGAVAVELVHEYLASQEGARSPVEPRARDGHSPEAHA